MFCLVGPANKKKLDKIDRLDIPTYNIPSFTDVLPTTRDLNDEMPKIKPLEV